MPTFISILRGINVGAQRKLPMAELKLIYGSLGLKDIVTYIQSGNVIFTLAGRRDIPALSRQLEALILEKYRFRVPVLIRSVAEMEKVVAGNPFLKEKGIDPEKLHVTFLGEEPGVPAIDPPANCGDRFFISGREVYLYCPNGYGTSKLSNAFFEQKLKVTATTRNWKTVQKLLALAT